MEELPLSILCHRVGIFLAEEAEIVGVLELLDRGGIASELSIEALDSAGILGAAVDHFNLAIPLGLLRNARGDRSNSEHHQGHHEDEDHQHVAALAGTGCRRDTHEDLQPAVRGIVCRLLPSRSSISTELLLIL